METTHPKTLKAKEKMIGQVFGDFRVMEHVERPEGVYRQDNQQYLYQCVKCGYQKIRSKYQLQLYKRGLECGICKDSEIVGRQYGSLTITSRDGLGVTAKCTCGDEREYSLVAVKLHANKVTPGCPRCSRLNYRNSFWYKGQRLSLAEFAREVGLTRQRIDQLKKLHGIQGLGPYFIRREQELKLQHENPLS